MAVWGSAARTAPSPPPQARFGEPTVRGRVTWRPVPGQVPRTAPRLIPHVAPHRAEMRGGLRRARARA